jgi:hypothetical protein
MRQNSYRNLLEVKYGGLPCIFLLNLYFLDAFTFKLFVFVILKELAYEVGSGHA